MKIVKNISRYILFVVSILLSLFFVSKILTNEEVYAGDNYSWTLSTIDPGNFFYGADSTSIIIDNSGNYIVSYIHKSGAELKFAKSIDNGLNWTTTVIDDIDGGWWDTSLKVDNSGDYVISYHDATGEDLMFAKSEDGGSNWTTSTIDSAGNIGWLNSLAIDGSDNYIISYFDATNTNLKFAKSEDGGSNWTTSTIDSTGHTGRGTSITIDDSDNYLIAYYYYSGHDLKFAKSEDGGSNWTTSTIDSAGDVGYYPSIVVDDSNNYIISYRDYTNRDLKFARSKDAGLNWTTDTIDSMGDVGSDGSIAVDGSGHYIISYQDSTNSALKFAKSEDEGLNWITDTISNGGLDSSIAIDSFNNYIVSYNGGSSLDFAKYALDIEAPAIRVKALTPNPYPDREVSFKGRARDGGGVESVQYQVDSTSGIWTSCEPDDEEFGSADEYFTCDITLTTEGSHTVYLRATDGFGNITGSGEYTTDSFEIDTSEVIEIYTIEDLDDVRNDLTAAYKLTNDLDFNSCDSYDNCANKPTYTTGDGWDPIGYLQIDPVEGDFTEEHLFQGYFNGQGHEISNLFVDNSTPGFNLGIGLFGANKGIIKNLAIINIDVTGLYWVGGLVGINSEGNISNCLSTGTVAGTDQFMGEFSISGGLVGFNDSILGGSSYIKSFIGDSYSRIDVEGINLVGGLVGMNGGIIANSYSTETVSGTFAVGGLVGMNQSFFSASGTVRNSFWDTQTSGTAISDGGTGKMTAQMKALTTFGTWDILGVNSFVSPNDSTWFIDDGNEYPQLFFEDYNYPQANTPTASNIEEYSVTLNGNLTSLGTESSIKVYFQYKPEGGTWINTPKVSKTSTGTYNTTLGGLNPNSDYQYRAVVEYGSTVTNYSSTQSFTTELVDIPKVIITEIGLIRDILIRDRVLYYFTSTTPTIRGTAYPESYVKFSTDEEDFITQANSEGEFEIELDLDTGTNEIEYYAYNSFGSQSDTRELTLVIGTGNFPDWLLDKLGLLTPTEDLEEETEEDTDNDQDDTEQEDTDQEDGTTIQTLQFLDEEGNPLQQATVEIDGSTYITDSNGEIQVDLNRSRDYQVTVEHDGKTYETDILGTDETVDRLILTLSEEDVSEGLDWKDILLYGGIGIVLIIIFILIFSRSNREEI